MKEYKVLKSAASTNQNILKEGNLFMAVKRLWYLTVTFQLENDFFFHITYESSFLGRNLQSTGSIFF
jgi:hypothetical protein